MSVSSRHKRTLIVPRFWHGLKAAYLIVFLWAGVSCQEPSKKQPASSVIDSPAHNDIAGLDSLDLDSSSFIHTNFPDTVNKCFNEINSSLRDYIDQSIIDFKSTRRFSSDSFKMILKNNNFIADSFENKLIWRKRQFNKRFVLEFKKVKPDTIIIDNQFWYLGRRYELVNQYIYDLP